MDNTVRTYDAYDLAGNAKSITDENGNTTTYVYDVMNRVRKIMEPAAVVRNAQNVLVTTHPVETFIYDNAGNQTSVTDPDGNVTLMTYDMSVPSRMLTRTDGAGGTMTYKYDAKEQLFEVDDQLGHPTTFFYDLRYRLIKQTDPLGHSTIDGYDGGTQPTSITDARGFTTYFEYDARGRLVRTIDPYGNPTNTAPCLPGDSVHTIRILLGMIYGMKAALPHLKLQDSGTIINVSSVLGARAYRSRPPIPPPSSASADLPIRCEWNSSTKAATSPLRRSCRHRSIPRSSTTPAPRWARSRSRSRQSMSQARWPRRSCSRPRIRAGTSLSARRAR